MTNKIKIFENVIEKYNGTTRIINDGSLLCGETFKLTKKSCKMIAEKLAKQWNIRYDLGLTEKLADEFFNKFYPESSCNN
jgi:hypothetical protein